MLQSQAREQAMRVIWETVQRSPISDTISLIMGRLQARCLPIILVIPLVQRSKDLG